MPTNLTLTFDQAGIDPGVVDRARTDLLSADAGSGRAAPITITIDGIPDGSTADIELLDEPPLSNPLLTQVDATHWTLAFDAGVWGPFRVRCRAVDSGRVVASVTRRISICSPTLGIAYPANGERTDPNATSVASVASVQITEMNEGGTNRPLVDFYRAVVEQLEAGAGGAFAGVDATARAAAAAAQSTANAAVPKSLYTGAANTLVVSVAGDSGLAPTPLVIPASTVLARLASGDIVAATAAEINTLIGGGVDSTARASAAAAQTTANAAVPKALFDANTVLAATVDDTPAAITMAASTILARLASGNIHAATVAEIQTLLAIAPAASGSAPLWQQPASPHTDDVEFTSALSGWDCRVQGTGTTNQAMTLGSSAMNAYSALTQGTGNVVVNTQRASWMHLQSWPTNVANNANPAVYCKALTSPATNMFLWARLGAWVAFSGTYDPGQLFQFCVAADTAGHPDPVNWIGVGLGAFSGNRCYQGQTYVAGALTTVPASANPSFATSAAPYEYFAIHKIGTVYHFWAFNDALHKMYLGSATVAGIAPAWFGFAWRWPNAGSGGPGCAVNCSDFIRRIDTASFPF